MPLPIDKFLFLCLIPPRHWLVVSGHATQLLNAVISTVGTHRISADRACGDSRHVLFVALLTIVPYPLIERAVCGIIEWQKFAIVELLHPCEMSVDERFS